MMAQKKVCPVVRIHVVALMVLAALGALAFSGCGGARMKSLSDQKFARLAPDDKVDIYVGALEGASEPVAVIESEAYAYVDEEVRGRQIEQLKSRARALGANTVHEIRYLTKHVQGYTADELVPFTSWKQGEYELHFLRGTAARVPETEPKRFDEIEPYGGWVVDQLKPPQPMETTLESIPGPGLKGK